MSNYTKTTNFLRKDSLPDTDADKIIRGSEFDTEFNNLVTAVASKANIVSPELTGVPRAPTAIAGTSTTQIATTAFVAQNAILKGMIVMWSGAVATIPTGYVLCDGTNATPDLRNRFVMGAGSTYSPGNTGGSADAVNVTHNHGGSVSVATKTLSGTIKTRNGGGGRYADSVPVSTTGVFTWKNLSGGVGNGWQGEGGGNSATITMNANHNHTATLTVNNAGVSGSGKNNPAYYALAFIMKT
jgi:hypothetical protein